MTTACAPGKIILLGEHAVVYGRPALAVPVRQVRACAHILPAETGEPGWVRLEAPDLGFAAWLHEATPDHPLAAVCRAALQAMRPAPFPPIRLSIESTIPVASGLGSSAAVSVAIARALNNHFGASLTTLELSALAYTGEQILHGTPSGIDNTVVAFDQPVFFVRGRPPEALDLRSAFHLVIGDTGIPAPTAQAVGQVRRRWQVDPAPLETLFDSIGETATQGRQAMIDGDPHRLGSCMNDDHRLLVDLGVSSPELDRLVESARAAGAFGAKMSGGGMGGNMVALASPEGADAVSRALRAAGAVGVIHTEVAP